MSEETFLKARALDWANELIRKLRPGHGVKQLQQGIPEDGQYCTLAECFRVSGVEPVSVGPESVTLTNPETGAEHVFETPGDVASFINAFDDRRFPELITPEFLDEERNAGIW